MTGSMSITCLIDRIRRVSISDIENAREEKQIVHAHSISRSMIKRLANRVLANHARSKSQTKIEEKKTVDRSIVIPRH